MEEKTTFPRVSHGDTEDIESASSADGGVEPSVQAHQEQGRTETISGPSGTKNVYVALPLLIDVGTVIMTKSSLSNTGPASNSAPKPQVAEGRFFFSNTVRTVLSPDQQIATGSKRPKRRQTAKRRPWLIVNALENDNFQVIACTSRAGKVWHGMERRHAKEFLPVGATPARFKRGALELLENGTHNGYMFFKDTTLVYLGVSTIANQAEFGDYIGELTPGALEIVKQELKLIEG